MQRDVADSPTEVAGTRRGRRGSRQGEARWWSQMAGPWGTVDTEGTFFVPGVTEAQGSPLSLAASGGGWSDLHFEKAIQGRTWGDRGRQCPDAGLGGDSRGRTAKGGIQSDPESWSVSRQCMCPGEAAAATPCPAGLTWSSQRQTREPFCPAVRLSVGTWQPRVLLFEKGPLNHLHFPLCLMRNGGRALSRWGGDQPEGE